MNLEELKERTSLNSDLQYVLHVTKYTHVSSRVIVESDEVMIVMDGLSMWINSSRSNLYDTPHEFKVIDGAVINDVYAGIRNVPSLAERTKAEAEKRLEMQGN